MKKPGGRTLLEAIRRKVCAHTQSHKNVPKLGGTLSRNAQRGTETHRAHTETHTGMHVRTRAKARRHRDPLRNMQTESEAHKCGHTYAQAGRHTNPQEYTNRLRHTHTQAHTDMHAPTETHPSRDTIEMPKYPHSWKGCSKPPWLVGMLAGGKHRSLL